MRIFAAQRLTGSAIFSEQVFSASDTVLVRSEVSVSYPIFQLVRSEATAEYQIRQSARSEQEISYGVLNQVTKVTSISYEIDGLELPPDSNGLAVSLTEARYYARVDGNEHDIGLRTSILAYTATAEHITGRKLINAPYTLKFDKFPASIAIPAAPLDSITSFTYVDADGAEQQLAPEAYRVNNANEITPALGEAWPATAFVADAVKVTLVCGYGANHATTPEGFKAYILAKIAEEFNPPRVARPDMFERLLDQYKVYN